MHKHFKSSDYVNPASKLRLSHFMCTQKEIPFKFFCLPVDLPTFRRRYNCGDATPSTILGLVFQKQTKSIKLQLLQSLCSIHPHVENVIEILLQNDVALLTSSFEEGQFWPKRQGKSAHYS